MAIREVRFAFELTLAALDSSALVKAVFNREIPLFRRAMVAIALDRFHDQQAFG
ncbi:hypothetical protein [Caballeronia sp. dw_19]|uniref:hypothetical protein n=1 Tax=Caballeronia sp. dw_19 TaxID=2719791 RepID=UPI001BD1FF02|nr:hypothetical protein [Caballeronia sp. dw_19]